MLLPTAYSAETISLGTLDLSLLQQDWGQPHTNNRFDGHPLSIGGQGFEQGVGTHANSVFLHRP